MSVNSFIKELLDQKDHSQIEFLKDINTNSIIRLICSYLNGEGGWIIVGHTGVKLVGLSDIDDNTLNNLKNNVNKRIFPQPLIYIQQDVLDNKNIILINVLKGARQPYSVDNKYYVRSGKVTREASPDDISRLLRSSNEYTSTWEKLSSIDATFNNLDKDEIQKTIIEGNRLGKGSNIPDEMEGFLSYFQLADYNSVKNGAIVLFGIHPIEFLPQCRIRITIMLSGKIGNKYEDTEIIEDNLFASFNSVHDYFRRNIPIVSEFKNDNWDRISIEKYPSDALDEAIVNALVHRDYGDISGDITINIYSSKIEIINSGEIPTGIIDNKVIKPHHSILRNPAIAHMFYLRGKMEKLGRGLTLIKERFKERGLQDPEWTFLNGYTTLTLYGIPKPIEVNDRMKIFIMKLQIGEEFIREDYERFF